MTSMLIDVALEVLWLFMLEVCGIVGISKIAFFNFSRSEKAKQNKKQIKTTQNLLSF